MQHIEAARSEPTMRDPHRAIMEGLRAAEPAVTSVCLVRRGAPILCRAGVDALK